VNENDEVIVPELTWIATAAPISYLNASPVFVDVDASSLCLSVPSFEAAVTPRTKALIAVDLYGDFPEMEDLLLYAKEKNIIVIEDAAQAVGSEYRSKPAGSFGQVSVFSFHGSKTLTTGEGGMLLCDSEEIYKRALFLRDHGRDPSRAFWNVEVAFKYRMSSMQAALGLAQLERLEELVAKKRKIFGWYEERLRGYSWIRLNRRSNEILSSFWMTTALIDSALKVEKEILVSELKTLGVESRPLFYPLSSLPAYSQMDAAKLAPVRNKAAYSLSPYGINLPSALNLDEDDVEQICHLLVRAIRSITSMKL
jgi:perosamine synthetase